MDKKTLVLLALGILGLGFISYKITYAFFSNVASSTGNVFTASDAFPTVTVTPSVTPTDTPTPTPSLTPSVNHIVINEVSPNGGNTQDWVELFNPTNSAIDVSGWIITDNTSSDTFPSVTPIPSAGFAVIVGSTSVVSVPVSAIKIQLSNPTIGNGLAASGDRLILKNGSTTIDQMSFGSDTSIFSIATPSASQTIDRHPNGTDTDSTADWVDEAATLGITNL